MTERWIANKWKKNKTSDRKKKMETEKSFSIKNLFGDEQNLKH